MELENRDNIICKILSHYKKLLNCIVQVTRYKFNKMTMNKMKILFIKRQITHLNTKYFKVFP